MRLAPSSVEQRAFWRGYAPTGQATVRIKAVKDAPLAGKRVTEILTRDKLLRLYHYLHNENGWNQFVMAFNSETWRACYVRSKHIASADAIQRSVDTIDVNVQPPHQMAYAPYVRNHHGQSRFGVLDFDAHDGDV